MAKKLITMAEYSRLRQLNRSTISRHVMSGLIPTHGPRRLIDPREADRHLRKHLDPSRTNAQGAPSETGLNSARTQHAYWKAELARLELKEKLGQVWDTAGCKRAWAQIVAFCHKPAELEETITTAAAETELHRVVLILKSAMSDILESWHSEGKRRSKAEGSDTNANTHEAEEVPDPSNYRQCLERREYYMAEMKKLQVGIKKGQYVYQDELKKAMTDAISGLRQRLMAVPNQVGAQVSATNDPQEVKAILEKAFSAAVNDLPQDITARLTVVNVAEDRAGKSN